MRVLINDHAALENHKSGIGYYSTELIRSLRGLLGRDQVETCPGPWIIWQQHWWERQSKRWEHVARQPRWLPWIEKKFRGKFLSLVRKVMPPPSEDLGEILSRHAHCDLYHEP